MTTLNGREVSSCFEITQNISGWYRNYEQHVTAEVDSCGNVELKRTKESGMLNFFELLEEFEFEDAFNNYKNYKYNRVKISFYGKNTRVCQVGRSRFSVTEPNKIYISGFFLPDLFLAGNIIRLYDALRPYGFNKEFIFYGKDSDEILKFFEQKFKEFKLRGLKLRNRWRMPEWLLNKTNSIEDFEKYESLWLKYISYEECEKRRLKYSAPTARTRSTRTVQFCGPIEYRAANNCLYDCIGSIINKINSLDPISVWTDGFALYAHLYNGSNEYICRSWVEETLDAIDKYYFGPLKK